MLLLDSSAGISIQLELVWTIRSNLVVLGLVA